MPNHVTRRAKPVLSFHQKQIRFITGLAVTVCGAVALALFWYLSRVSFATH